MARGKRGGHATRPVVVVGAGLAGLTAASALARAGIRAVVVEAGEVPGGRLATVGEGAIRHAGETWRFPLARGLPVIGEGHRNLRRLLEAYGLAGDLVPLDRRELILPPVLGRVRRVAVGGAAGGPGRFLGAAAATVSLGPALLRARAAAALSHALAFGGQDDVPLYDRLSAADVLAGLPPPVRALARAFGQVRLAVEPEEASLAAFLAALDPGGGELRASLPTDPGAALFAPLVRALRHTGAEVLLGVRAEEVAVERDAAAGVVVRGPDGRRRIGAAAVIVAVDPPALRTLARQGRLEELLPRMRVPAGVPCAVIRLWFERDVRAARPPAGVLAGATPGRFFWLHRILRPHRRFHEGTGGAVLEVHLHGHAARTAASTGDEEVLSRLAEVADEVWPELAGSRIGGHVQRNPPTAPGYGPGVLGGLPGVETRAANLALAGDWIRAPWLALHAERACVTGLLAARQVAAAIGVDPAALPAPEAPGDAPTARGRTVLRALRARGFFPSLGGGGLPDEEPAPGGEAAA